MIHSRPVRSILAAALLAGALAACKGGNARPGEAELPPAQGAGAPAAPTLPKVTEDEQAVSVAGEGTIGTTFPRARAEVGPPISGVIQSIEVEEGAKVKKGQVLFRLRTSDLALGVEQARAGAAQADVALASVQTEYDRAKRLFDQKALEQAQLDRATAQLDAAKAAAKQAKVGVSRAQQVLGDAVVRSPIDGFVTHKLKNAGEMATMMPPTIVVVVEDHSVLELRFRVPEAKLPTLVVGMPIKAGFDALGQTREAKVSRIAPSVDPMTRTVEVIALLDNADGALKSGMLATVEPAAPAAAAPKPDAAPVVPEGRAAANTPSPASR